MSPRRYFSKDMYSPYFGKRDMHGLHNPKYHYVHGKDFEAKVERLFRKIFFFWQH